MVRIQTPLKSLLKSALGRVLGKSGPPVVPVFLSGDPDRSRAMALAMRDLAPQYPHLIIGAAPLDRAGYSYAAEIIEVDAARPLASWAAVRRRLRHCWIGLAPFLWTGGGPLRWMPWLLAPHKLLAFNRDLERHHLRLTCPIASWRFLRGEPVGDIFRPTALAFLKFWKRRERAAVRVFQGRTAGGRRRVAVVTPYLPFPLSHGGAIRIFNLLRESAAGADIHLFAFAEKESPREVEPLLQFCAQVVLVDAPRWDPPPALSLTPREARKFDSAAMQEAIAVAVCDQQIPIVQIEFTQLAHLGRGLNARAILVEHDVTFDLHRQQRQRARGWNKLGARIEEVRWRRYELGHARRFDRVVVMSSEDKHRLTREGIAPERIAIVENGVDLERLRPAPPDPLAVPEILFIGSFRHFPNVLGYRFLVERVWPILRQARPDLRLTVVAGPDPSYYWRRHTGEPLPPPEPGVDRLAFVEDVRPLYERATLVVVPLVVSAGTNLKVLEALAMGRAVVSTAVGVAGLGLTSGQNVMLADTAAGFAAATLNLLVDTAARQQIAARGRAFVEARYGWPALAKKLVAVWDDLQ